MMICKRFKSNPEALRCGNPNCVFVTSAWTSTRIGRVPSIMLVTTDPEEASGRSSNNNSDGLVTCCIPSSLMLNMPISSTGPNRFFKARKIRVSPERSPSIKNNASIRCSRVFGPATPPSLFT